MTMKLLQNNMILAYLHITIKLYSKEVFIHTTEVHNVGLMNATKMICPVLQWLYYS